MSIRRAPRPQSQFYVLDNRIAADERLSWQARGLLIFLLTKPDNWEISVAHLVKQTENAGKKSGRDAVYAMFKELQEAGYLRRTSVRGEDGSFSGTEYEVSESPDQPLTDNPDTDNPDTANPTQISTDNKTSTEKEKKTECSKDKFSQDDLKAAQWMLDRLLMDIPDYKNYNIKTWANEVRLMRERDQRTHHEICQLWAFARNHHFWHVNILSPGKLRKQFDRLKLEMRGPHDKPAKRQSSVVETLLEERNRDHDPRLVGGDDGHVWEPVDEPVREPDRSSETVE